MDTKVDHAEKVSQMQDALNERLKTRVLLALRYHSLCLHSQNMIKQKLERMLLVKALDALKYATVSQRICKSYVVFREAKVRKEMFQKWSYRLTQITAQKHKLRPFLSSLNKQNKTSSFLLWKKNTFRLKFLATLQQSLLFSP